MAAENGSHYGALVLEEEDLKLESRRPAGRLTMAAVAMLMCVVGVFAMTAGYSTNSASQVANVAAEEGWEEPGNGDTRGPDCKCASACSATPEPVLGRSPLNTQDAHYCDVIYDVDGPARPCIGIDGRFFSEHPAYDGSLGCVNDDGTPNGNCKVMCEFVMGRYDCWSFPCWNGGACVDGQDAVTCICAEGYGGPDCKEDRDECTYLDEPDADGNGLDDLRKVCDDMATCKNEHGTYTCTCNPGWEGDGYVADGVLTSIVLPEDQKHPWWITRPEAGEEDFDTYIQGCQDIDACREPKCENGGTCLNTLGGVGLDDFDCECADGPTGSKAWTGKTCTVDIDECAEGLHDCDPMAECANTPGGFTCHCKEHWQSTDLNFIDRLGRMWGTGKSEPGCYDWPDCESGPCEHGGTCMEGPDGCQVTNLDGNGWNMVDCYKCNCAYGYSGSDCEFDENECKDSEQGDYVVLLETCHSEAFCVNTPGSYECTCNAGWTGDGITCIDADDCEFSPCAHGGTCYDCGTLCFTCDCVVGWRGTTCGTDWNECIMGIHQCNNEATCANNPGSYDCRCDPGFTGTGFGSGFTAITTTYSIGAQTITETIFHGCKDIDDCDPELYDGPALSPEGPCVMGTCNDVGPNAYVCSCIDGYTDANCDMNINECDPILGENQCHRFAECSDTTGSYLCACNEGYTGNGYSSCLDISDCYGQCEHGFCSDLGVDDFKCTCDAGYMNRKCDYNVNECTTYTHECARHALCEDKIPAKDGVFYTCTCNKGWSGDGMAQGLGCRDIDDCVSEPCDFGDCTDEGAAAYTCECQEGFTDFNCDFDVNECYLKTHNCHVDARCVNIPGGFFCRCLAGWEGDGLTCTDLDDCDPDPCDPTHGTCEDMGANSYHCNCEGGWCGAGCDSDCNECVDGTHSCDPNASCANTYGSHECTCNSDFYGPATGPCTPCTVCPPGWKATGVCEFSDLTCVNVDECVEEVDDCHDHATCLDNQGSFKCECDQNGSEDEWWGIGINTEAGCERCTACYDGFHEIQPCTSTTDRICETNVADGMYMLESEADDNKSCVALMKGEWYPSRVNFGNGEELCGFPGVTEADKKIALMADGQVLFEFRALGDNDQTKQRGGDFYTISFNDGDGSRCLFFGDQGKDIYPSLQNCGAYEIDDQDSCPWNNGAQGLDYCGFSKDGETPKNALEANLQAIWRVTPLKLNENKYILQSASKGHKGQDGTPIWECLAFEEQGAATNPSRYNWGNGDTWCGAGDWEGEGKVYGLLNNKQAVFILTFMQGI